METDRPKLFVEINDKNFIFIACAHDENQNLKVIEKIITSSEGLDKNKFINIVGKIYILITNNVQ